MEFRQFFQTRADAVKLVNFIEDSFKSHGCALFIRAKWKKTSDGLLSSEDLKEEKVVTTPLISISRYHAPDGLFHTSGANKALAHRPLMREQWFSLCSVFSV